MTAVHQFVPTLAPRVIHNVAVDALAVVLSFGSIAVYSVLAIRRVYGGSLSGAIVRSGALAAIYFAVFTVAMLLTFAIAALRV